MKHLPRIAAVLLLAAACSTAYASELDGLKDQVSQAKLQEYVLELSTRPPTTPGGSRQPRLRYSDAERAEARAYLVGLLTSYGYDVHLEAVTSSRDGSVIGQNIVASRRGAVSDAVFVVGAHYDTVQTSPGADDNASGVAGVLEIARVLSGHQLDATLEFVLFDLEERGLTGSRAYVAKSVADGKQIIGVMNFDMIGFTHAVQQHTIPTSLPDRIVTAAPNVDISKGTFVAVIANSGDQPVDANVSAWQWRSAGAPGVRSTDLAASFVAAAQQLGTAGPQPSLPAGTLTVKDNGSATPDSRRSDHASFWVQGIPAVQVTDTSEFRDGRERYHTMNDTHDKLDFDFMTKVVQATLLATLDFVGLAEYSVSDSVPLLEAPFYRRGTADELEVTSAFPNRQGAGTAYWATKKATGERAIFRMDAYYPSSYHQITDFAPQSPGPALPLTWCPDDRAIVTGDRIVRIYEDVKRLVPYRPHTKAIAGKGSFTRLGAQNWYVDVVAGNIWAMPVQPGARDDTSRNPVAVTNFPSHLVNDFGWVHVSPDGKRLAFSHQKSDGTQAIYCIPDLTAILQAPASASTQISSKALTSFTDPAVTTLRESRQLADWPYFLWYESHVSYVESHPTTGADVVISDVPGRLIPRRIAQPRNQGTAIPFLGGSRVLCSNVSETEPGVSIATIRVSAPTIASTAIKLDDGNGSSLQIDNGTTINFPPGEKKEVFLETSIRQIDLGRFPDNVQATDAGRTIGPYGATFSQPVTVTIQYTDPELLGHSDAAPQIFGFVKETNLYSRPVPVISHDAATNTVVFKVSYASTFVLAVPGNAQ